MNRQSAIDALLFDLGGVLVRIDFERALAHWAGCARADVGTLRSRFVFDPTLIRYECGEIARQEYFAHLRRTLAIDIPDDEFDRGWNAIFLGEVEGIQALLGTLQGQVPMYVFSNTNVDHQRVWSSRYAHVLRPFDRVFCSNELGKRKPAPEAFHAVARAIDVPPERILFFDDTLKNVEGAMAVGMQAVHVRSITDIEEAVRQRTPLILTER
jgi:putative hydrolase of the HAD superfamily